MHLVLRRSCCKLETAVYAIGIILTTLYLVVGLGGVVWFVLCHMEDSDVMTKLKELYLLKVTILLFKSLIIECKSDLFGVIFLLFISNAKILFYPV